MTNETKVPLDFSGPAVTPSAKIQRFEDIPDIRAMDIPPVEWIVPGFVAANTITLWAGQDGVAKTYLAQKMAVEIARGGLFLGRKCRSMPVMYLDYENPSFAVRERVDGLCGELADSFPYPRFWGTWLETQPPLIGSDLLLTIASELRGVIVVDPFRYAHAGDENDSTVMSATMQHLRYCAARGNAIVILHHVGKADGSTGRGSSAVRAACDHAFLQEITEDSSLITLKSTKNRFGPRHSITIRADFDSGTFEVCDSPQFTQRQVEEEKLQTIVETTPGLTQNELCGRSSMMRERAMKLLKEGVGTLWDARRDGRSIRYYPLSSNLIAISKSAGKTNGAAL